jgi:ParB-like chromosome segregation protein Spo0J
VAYDAERRLILAVVPGARSIENAAEAVREVHDRTAGRADMLPTSDEHLAYETAIEQAKAFKSLMDRNGWSGDQAAKALGKALGVAQPTVVRALALLELPDPVRERVEQGTLPPGTAYEIGKVHDPEIQQELAERVVSEDSASWFL